MYKTSNKLTSFKKRQEKEYRNIFLKSYWTQKQYQDINTSDEESEPISTNSHHSQDNDGFILVTYNNKKHNKSRKILTSKNNQ